MYKVETLFLLCTSSEQDSHVVDFVMGEYRITRNFAVVHTEAKLGDGVLLEPHSVVHEGAKIDHGTKIGSNSVIGKDVRIGSNCQIGCNVCIENCEMGDFCVIHNGACIGQDGFGFLFDENKQVVKKPQTRKVIIGNGVEVGANSCVDRGSWRDTVIGDQTKIDNLVQIGHNVNIKGPAFICGQAGLAGSVTLGSYVRLAGRSGCTDHVTVGDDVDIAACSVLTKDAPSGTVWAGFPAQDIRGWKKELLALRKLSKSYDSIGQPGSASSTTGTEKNLFWQMGSKPKRLIFPLALVSFSMGLFIMSMPAYSIFSNKSTHSNLSVYHECFHDKTLLQKRDSKRYDA